MCGIFFAERNGFGSGGIGDDGERLQRFDGRVGEVEALGVGTYVGRGKEESFVFDKRVEEGAVERREAFEEVASEEGEAKPKALGAGAGEEDATGETFGIGLVGEVEVADKGDPANRAEGDGKEASFEVEQLDVGASENAGEWEVAGPQGALEGADDHLFAGRGHRAAGSLWECFESTALGELCRV